MRVATAIVWIRCARETGERTAQHQGKPRGSCLDAYVAPIMSMIEVQKDITLNETVVRLRDEVDIIISRSGLNVWLRSRSFTFKKDRTCIGAGSARYSEETEALVQLPVGP